MDNAFMYKSVVSKNLLSLMKEDPRIDGNENELARLSGVPQPTINRILKGESGNPRRPTLEKIGRVFGIKPEDFYREVITPDFMAREPKALYDVSHDPLLAQLIEAYEKASLEARKMATLLLMADAELGGVDKLPSNVLPRLKSRAKRTKKRNHAET